MRTDLVIQTVENLTGGDDHSLKPLELLDRVKSGEVDFVKIQ